MKKMKTEIAIIGAGSAGLAAYRTAKTHGKQALLIESGAYGTTCARVGCMPTKLLSAAASVAYEARRAAPFGIDIPEVKVDGKRVMERVLNERDRFVGFVLDGIHAIDDADKLRGYARFRSPNTLLVGQDTEVTAERFVIATGSRPEVPDMFKGAGDRVIVNDNVFYWTELPRRVAVFGIGVIGLEIGQSLSRLGVDVHLFGMGGFVGPLSDPEVLESARQAFSDELCIDFYSGVKTIEKVGDEVVVEYLQKTKNEFVKKQFDYVLVATGRTPNVDDLGLENTPIELDNRGIPLFNTETMQCGDHPYFIAGDADKYLPLLHEATDEGTIAGHNAAIWPKVYPGLRRTPINIIFSDPALMMVGTRYADLLPYSFVTGQVDFSNQGRSRIILKNKGLLRVYVDNESHRFLGAEMVGPKAEHIAHLLAWSHQMGLTVERMLEMPFYHPVVEEGVRTALRDALAQLKAES